MFKLEVGKPFDLFVGKNIIGQDGCVLELLHGGGYFLAVYLNHITEKEKLVLKNEKMNIRVIHESDFVLTLIRYGFTSLVFEVVFDPTLYKDERVNQFLTSNMLTVVGIESTNNTIQTLRYVSIPLNLFSIWNISRENAKKQENYSQKYSKWIDDLDKRYSILKLWDLAKPIGYLGQTDKL